MKNKTKLISQLCILAGLAGCGSGVTGSGSSIKNANQVANSLSKSTVMATKIMVSPDSAETIVMGNKFNFSVTINGTTNNSTVVSARFINPLVLGNIINSESSPCVLDSASGKTSCHFSATIANYSQWNTELLNGLNSSYQIEVSSNNNLPVVESLLNFSVVTPSVYLAVTGQTPILPVNPAPEGSDGDIHAGVNVTKRFTQGTGVEANCIIDNLTGLMWIKDLNTVQINSAELGSATNWQNALDSIESMNKTTGYCGHNDWHIPTVNEISSLINYSENSNSWLNNPAQGFENVENYYWSSTSYGADNKDAWEISVISGYELPENKTYSNYVWPVRRVQ